MLDYSKYEETFNCFINYKRLSSFLIEKLDFPENETTFIDFPCGGGNLLSEMVQSNFHLAGIDLSSKQTQKAQSIIGKNAKIFTANCFESEQIIKEFNLAIVHCGNSFIQNFNALKQSQLLKYILSIKNVFKIIIEYSVHDKKFKRVA